MKQIDGMLQAHVDIPKHNKNYNLLYCYYILIKLIFIT